MEIEKMRETLARGMGWKRQGEHWVDEHGAIECRADWWEPDEDPVQMMRVIDMMRRDGWEWHLRDDASVQVSVQRYDTGIVTEGCAEGSDECYVRMLAAYRALESEANDE